MVCFCWSNRLYGVYAGFIALSLWCFSPYFLGHASVVIPDAHAASLGVVACYSFWLWLREPKLAKDYRWGVVLGLAELCKFTLLILYPLLPLLWLIYRCLSEKC